MGGLGQMIMFDYRVGGWVWIDDYVIILEKNLAFGILKKRKYGTSRFCRVISKILRKTSLQRYALGFSKK